MSKSATGFFRLRRISLLFWPPLGTAVRVAAISILAFALNSSGCDDGLSLARQWPDSTKRTSTGRSAAETIYFISNHTGTGQIYSMDAEGSDVQPVTADAAKPIFSASLSRDRSMMVVESIVDTADSNEIHGLYKLDMAMKQLTLIYIPTSNGPASPYSREIHFPTISPDNQYVAYSRSADLGIIGIANIFVVRTDGQGDRPVTNNYLRNYALDWSADGRTLLGTTTRSNTSDSLAPFGEYEVIAEFDLKGIILRSWECKGYFLMWPRYSHSGKKITAFTNRTQGPYQDVLVFNVETDSMRDIITDHSKFRYFKPYAWSPDDAWVLCTANGWRLPGKIVKVNINTGEIVDISPSIWKPGVDIKPFAWVGKMVNR